MFVILYTLYLQIQRKSWHCKIFSFTNSLYEEITLISFGSLIKKDFVVLILDITSLNSAVLSFVYKILAQSKNPVNSMRLSQFYEKFKI